MLEKLRQTLTRFFNLDALNPCDRCFGYPDASVCFYCPTALKWDRRHSNNP